MYMVTPDKDYGQIVEEKIFMYKPSRQGNGNEIWGIKEVTENWGVQRVDQVIDMLALQGDAVDNIPGVPGIGEKTAAKLLAEFDHLENLLANADQISGKIKEKIIQYADQARLSKRLATIDIDVPIRFDEKAYRIEHFDKQKLSELFRELEFRSLALAILGESEEPNTLFSSATIGSSSVKKEEIPESKSEEYRIADRDIQNTAHQYHLVMTEDEIKSLIQLLDKTEIISFDTETTGIDANQAELVGMSFSIKAAEAYYIPIPKDQTEAKKIIEKFRAVLENSSKKFIGQNIKYDMLMMKWYGIEMPTPEFDTMIAHYLLEPDQRHKLDYLSEAFLNYKMVPIEALIGKKSSSQGSMRDVPLEKIKEYAGEDADVTLQIKSILAEDLNKQNTLHILKDIELPLVTVLRDVEYEGVRVDSKFLNDYSKVLEKLVHEKEQSIYQQAGSRFNISSPKQVGEILFDKLKIPYKWKKTSTQQYSTDEEKLNELAEEHEVVSTILEYRKLAKLKSTYVDSLPLMINPKTGRIHSSFNQARAATGRLASENPNLQNIPIKDEAGREIRKAFIPRDEQHVLISADYSQIELRLIAEISKEQNMLEAFAKQQDIHRATAAKVYGVAYDEVSSEQRRNAKTVNFSIIYGAGATNISRQLGLGRAEAKDLIENYFKTYSGLNKYMQEVVEDARKNGYVTTLLGRKRILRDIDSKNGLARSNAERVAINTPIQGTAADLIKLAMINIHRRLKQEKYGTKMILQVHDELVFDAPVNEKEKVMELILHEMKNAIPNLKVPIEVGIGSGQNWLEAH